MKKFGTDGIRGIVNSDLDKDTIFFAGKALAEMSDFKKILVARDNRTSGEYVVSLFISGLLAGGANVYDVGYLSTPGVSYLTKFYGYDFGVMISASHNPPEYNGIKIFNSSGKKIDTDEEKRIEQKMENTTFKNIFGKYKSVPYQKEKYFDYIKKIGLKPKNITLLADLSNGVTSFYAKNLFNGIEVNVINNNPDGRFINKNAGILYPEILLEKKKETGSDFALAVDGDGDRIMIIDRYNNILSGDHILYILSYYFKRYYKINCVVGTIQTNLGIEKALNSLGINLIRSDVGDKNVINEICKNHLLIGGEQSGHIIIKEYLPTGDGLLAGIITLGIITELENNNEYKNMISGIKIMPQLTENYAFINPDILNVKEVSDFIKNKKLLAGNDYRIIVRKSGSENVIRVTSEGRDELINKNNVDEIIKKLVEYDN